LLALAFLAFAYVNLNDPDGWMWVAAYGATAVLFALAFFGRADRRISGWLALALTVWLITLAPGMLDWLDADMPSITEEMQAKEPHIEVVREFMGLAIAVLALIHLTLSVPKEARLG
jgi:hypothetical protein